MSEVKSTPETIELEGSGFWQKPENLLLTMTFTLSFMFATWQVLLNNFVIERAAFTGVEIGILQSLREVPGFLAFTAVFVLLIIREQFFALLAVAVMALGVALTGFFPFGGGYGAGGGVDGLFPFRYWPVFNHGRDVYRFSLF